MDSDNPDTSAAPLRDAPGWKELRRRYEEGHKAKFVPIRDAIKRNEFIGSVIELFVSALIGVTQFNLGVQDPANAESSNISDPDAEVNPLQNAGESLKGDTPVPPDNLPQ